MSIQFELSRSEVVDMSMVVADDQDDVSTVDEVTQTLLGRAGLPAFAATHRVELLRCEGSDAIGAKRTCRELAGVSMWTKMTQSRQSAAHFAVVHNTSLAHRYARVVLDLMDKAHEAARVHHVLGGAAAAWPLARARSSRRCR